ncbi:MAG TPA: sodium:proton antiporter, partial [Rhodospirillaceae bacterium]|nr:sodium:proton antiporter [Rhodospirillaceae bacterium]
IDMPPGTGDAQLTLAQKLKLTGAIVVSTPQDLALIDARRGIAMFERVAVPVLGIIENMSVFTCPHCGEDSHIFGHGGAVEEAKQRGIPLLGQIPLTMSLREQADAGQPLVGQNNADPAAKAFLDIAVGIRDSLTEHGTNVPKAPTITWL